MMRAVFGFVMGLNLVVLVPVLSVAQGGGQEKVTICHKEGENNQHTIVVAKSAVNTHLKHGDTLGPCPGTPSK